MQDDRSEQRHFETAQPDDFDREFGQAQGFPSTRATTVTDSKLLGVGGVRSYIVQTFRVPEVGDKVFITITGPEGLKRIHLPPKVTSVVASQRDALSTLSRRRAAKARAAADKAAGRQPGFMRKKQK